MDFVNFCFGPNFVILKGGNEERFCAILFEYGENRRIRSIENRLDPVKFR